MSDGDAVVIRITELAPARPPCSVAERESAETFATLLRRFDLRTEIERLRAPTSPTWVPLVRALLRVWSVALLAAYRPLPALVLAGLAIVTGLGPVSGLIRYVPLLGDNTQNVVAQRSGSDPALKPLVVIAHLDTHPTAGAPMRRSHALLGALSGFLALAASLIARPGIAGWRLASIVVAGEAIVTLTWLARHELRTPHQLPDDNTSGLLALLRVAELVADPQPARDVWIVATGAGTSGGHGLSAFLRRRPALRQAWVVEIDALGAGEVVASPFPPRFPRPGTPSMLIRAIVEAARETGDPLSVRRVRRPHSDARAALRMRTGAIALTAGLRPPAGEQGPDPANAERAARVVDRLARQAA